MFANYYSNFLPDPLVHHVYEEKGKAVSIIRLRYLSPLH